MAYFPCFFTSVDFFMISLPTYTRVLCHILFIFCSECVYIYFLVNIHRGFISFSIHFLFRKGIYLFSSQRTQVCYFLGQPFYCQRTQGFYFIFVFFVNWTNPPPPLQLLKYINLSFRSLATVCHFRTSKEDFISSTYKTPIFHI